MAVWSEHATSALTTRNVVNQGLNILYISLYTQCCFSNHGTPKVRLPLRTFFSTEAVFQDTSRERLWQALDSRLMGQHLTQDTLVDAH